jgi:2-keto-3-deoxy-L-fuconate dehydrogenase
MATETAQVCATDVNAKLLESYGGMSNIHTATLNVLNEAAIRKIVAEIPPLDVLFNCAGLVHAGTAIQATDEEWDLAFALNVRSQYWTIQAALPHILSNNDGKGGSSIINMASVVSTRGCRTGLFTARPRPP